MRDAGVNLVTVGVFAWSRLEPEPGRHTLDWLDRVLDLLHAAGIRAALATPTASPPPWFSLRHPDALPVTADGVRLTHGSRDTYCAAAPAYRDAARSIAGVLADPVRAPPGAGAVARAQRVRHHLPLPARRGGVPPLAHRPLRRPRRAQRRLGHQLLEPALHRLGAGRHAPRHPVPGQPRPAARLPPLLVRHAAVRVLRAAGPAAGGEPGGAGDHQLRARRLGSASTTPAGRARWTWSRSTTTRPRPAWARRSRPRSPPTWPAAGPATAPDGRRRGCWPRARPTRSTPPGGCTPRNPAG